MEILFDVGGCLFTDSFNPAIKPLGTYMTNIYQGKHTFLSPVLVPLENLIYNGRHKAG